MKRDTVWDLTARCGGVFKFTVLVQKRVKELVRGAPKLIDENVTDPIEIAVMEIDQGLIELEDLTDAEVAELKESMEEQTAAQSLLAKDQGGKSATPGEPDPQSITEFLKS